LKRLSTIAIKLNILQLELGCFATIQVTCKVFTSKLRHQLPASRAQLNNHRLNLYLKLSIFT